MKKITITALLILAYWVASGTPALAVVSCGGVSCNGVCVGGTANGYCVPNPSGQAPQQNQPAAYFVSRFYEFALPIIGILGFLLILYSGFQYLMSKGDPKAVQAAQLRLTYAIGGLILVFLAYAILSLVTYLFGINQL
jgi:hypothetical protein